MISNYKLRISYSVDGERGVKHSESGDNADFSIETDGRAEDGIVMRLVPRRGKSIEIKSFRLELPYDFADKGGVRTRVYANGYQSWTDTREYTIDEHTPLFDGWFKDLMRITGALAIGGNDSYGDYRFTEYSRKAGRFHSFSYMYVRRGEEVDLFGSMNERTGYTIFYVDAENNLLTFAKDLEGKTIDGEYEVMNVRRYRGGYDEVFDRWFAEMNVPAPRKKHANGYTTWYNYYGNISEDIVLRDLKSLSEAGVKADIFQIDDGYQTATGDWLSVKKEFPRGMKYVADAIHEKGMLAGLWLAPFAAARSSKIFAEHKDEWFVKDRRGRLVKAGCNWGPFYTLDIYNPQARAYIEKVFSTVLGEWGFDMVKLDFLYEVAIVPYGNRTRGEIMCDAMDLLREVCGDKLILGCGVPLYPAFGKVDFCRIGADVSPSWEEGFFARRLHRERVSTVNTVNNSIFRRHLDGRAFVNDPDVFFLRDYNIAMGEQCRKTVRTVNKVFGNLLFVSDDVGRYGAKEKRELSETFADDEISVQRAEYVSANVFEAEYTVNGREERFEIDMRSGVLTQKDPTLKKN